MSAHDVAQRLRQRKRVEKVQTDEGVLYVRGLTGAERAGWVERFVESDLTVKERILSDHHLVALALCDEDGKNLFGTFEESFTCVCDFQDEDVREVAKKVMSISGLAAKAVESAEKKSDAIQS